jgi:hypothetical protein
MLRFQQYLNERYKNAIGDDPLKDQYADQVWSIIQKSYAPIGGIKGSGFNSIEDMKQKIPFWKMSVNNGKVNAVILYKDKGGRKSVAAGTDGTAIGKTKIQDMMKSDIERSYGEKSKSALGLMLKLYSPDALKPFVSTPEEASRVLKKDVTPIKDLSKEKWPEDAKKTVDRHPWLIYYGYVRDISGEPTFKVMIGAKGKTIR